MTAAGSIPNRLASSMQEGSPISNVSGVILAAGLGRRMGPLTVKLPKPLLPILNCPLIWWNMVAMRRHGVRDIAVNTHYLPAAFSGLRDEAATLGIRLSLINEAELSGPFGGVIACRAASNNADDILVFAGDGIYDVDVENLVSTHRQCDALLTVAVATVPDGHRYGVLDVDSSGVVRGMVEKPAGVGSVSTASCGVYVVSSRVFDVLGPVKSPIDWIDVVTRLIRFNRRVIAVRAGGWIDVGSPAGLLEINQRYLVPNMLRSVADLWSEIAGASVWTQGPLQCQPSARFRGTVLIGEGARIGVNARLEDAVVGSRARIGDGSVIRGALVLPEATVEDGVAVIGEVAN